MKRIDILSDSVSRRTLELGSDPLGQQATRPNRRRERAWSTIAAGEARDLVFIPTGSAGSGRHHQDRQPLRARPVDRQTLGHSRGARCP